MPHDPDSGEQVIGVLRRDDARRKAQTSQGATDKVGAQTGLHADDTRRQLPKLLDQRQAPYLAPQNNRVAEVKANQVKDILADVYANGRKDWNGPL